MAESPEIELKFEDAPFAFDEEGNIRCLKCHDAGWVVGDGSKSGLQWEAKKELNPPKGDTGYRLPDGWDRAGTYDRERLSVEGWQHMIEESWRQIRHLGKQRAAFIGIFGGLSAFGIVFSVAASTVSVWFKGIVILLLAGYTAFHTLMSIKMAKGYKHNMEHIDLLAAIAPQEVDASSFAMLRSMQGMILRKKWRSFQQSTSVVGFYVVVTIFWSLLGASFILKGILSLWGL